MNTKRQNLLHVLTAVQNSAKFEHQDIMTFSAFMTDDEMPGYVWDRFAMLPDADKAQVLDVARSVLGEAA